MNDDSWVIKKGDKKDSDSPYQYTKAYKEARRLLNFFDSCLAMVTDKEIFGDNVIIAGRRADKAD